MAERLSPRTAADVLAAVEWAAANASPLEIVGHGTKRGWGGVLRTNYMLDLAGLSGIGLYEPDELVLSAGPGTPLAEIETALAENGQQLAFEPPDFGPLFGQPDGVQTLGGVVASNLSGPRRIKAGAARDHFLGVEAVTGRAEAIKSGGRVVKNVTGYDLCKLFAGSFGTLGVMTSLTLKVLPAGQKTRTVLAYSLEDDLAVRALGHALNSPHDVSGAAHLPAEAAARSTLGYVRDRGASVTAVRVEGVGPSVAHRCAALRDLLSVYGDVEELHGRNSAVFWQEVGGVAAFLQPDESTAVWRISVPPAMGPAMISACHGLTQARWFYDWGGGLVWLACAAEEDRGGDPARDGGAEIVRAALRHGDAGGHATLVRAPELLREQVAPFQPPAPGVAALSDRLRRNFDPHGILNPGRMAPVQQTVAPGASASVG